MGTKQSWAPAIADGWPALIPLACIAATVWTLPSRSFAEQKAAEHKGLSAAQIQNLKSAVSACISTVHEMKPPAGYMTDAFKAYDAYYDASKDRVIDNVQTNFDLQARYYFNKCMASSGWSIS